MKTIKCIVIDDEPIAIEYLRKYIEQLSQLEFVDGFSRASHALPVILNEQIDLVFMDIQMPELSGIDFIRSLAKKPQIILTTAYSEYALEGYELNVVDYLLKPISFERFVQAISKIDSKREKIAISDQVEIKDFIFLKSGYKSVKVMISDITHVEGLKEYVAFYTMDKQKFIKNERLKVVEEQLNQFGFVRVHKSFLVNSSRIHSVYGNTIEINQFEIPIGRAYKDNVLRLIQN